MSTRAYLRGINVPLLRVNGLCIIFASCSLAYYVAEKALQSTFRCIWPNLYHELQKRGKATPFFALAMGILIIVFSTPSCYRAYTTLPVQAIINFSHPGPSEICIGARSVMWIEELLRLGNDTAYFLHHSMSLLVVASALWFKLPGAKYLCAVIGSLATELGISATWLLAYCGLKSADHRWIWWFENLNLALVVVVRGPAAYLLFSSPWHEGLHWTEQMAWVIPASMYVVYQTYVMFARIRRLRSAREAWTRKASHGTEKLHH